MEQIASTNELCPSPLVGLETTATTSLGAAMNSRLPGIYKYEEFAALKLERPQPAVAGLLAEGQNGVLIGQFAIGKTLLALQLSTCMATGKPFLGRPVLRPYKVAFVDCENGEAEIQERLRKQLDTVPLSDAERERLNQNWVYANARDPRTTLFGLSLDEGNLKPLEQFLDAYTPEIVFFDNLGRVIDGDLEKAEEVKEFFQVLVKLRETRPYLKTMLFLHHTTKPGDRKEGGQASLLTSPHDYLYRARGSGRLVDFSEFRLALAQEEVAGETYYIVNGILRSGTVEPLILQRNSDALVFELHDDKSFVIQKIFESSPRKKAVWDAICNRLQARFTFSEAVALTDDQGKAFNRTTVNDTLALGCANGLLARPHGATYYVRQWQRG